jgi:hypothetical protein
MRLTAITFSGYQSSHTDLAEVFDSNPETEREALLSMVERIADGIIDPNGGQFTSVIVVGHSDRQDDTSLSCDQRRASEIQSATARATSAWDWLKVKVTERLAQSGIVAGDWWETAPSRVCRRRDAAVRSSVPGATTAQPAGRVPRQHVRLRVAPKMLILL